MLASMIASTLAQRCAVKLRIFFKTKISQKVMFYKVVWRDFRNKFVEHHFCENISFLKKCVDVSVKNVSE